MSVDPRFYNEILPRLWRGGLWGYYWSNDDGQGSKVTVWKNLIKNPAPPVTPSWVGKLNCYFGIHPTKAKPPKDESYHRAKITDIACINCLYAEVDGIANEADEAEWIHWLLNDCPVRPSLIIWSGGGLHVYWLLEETFWLDSPEAMERAIVAQKAIVARIGGDTKVHDIARVLRVPGTINHKPERNGAIVEIRYWESDETYFLEEIEKRIPSFVQDVKEKRRLTEASTTQFESLGLDDQHVLRAMFSSRRKGELYRQLWEGDVSGVKDQDASAADMTLCDGLAWATGCDFDQVDRMFRQSGLMRPKWDEARGASTYGADTINKAINTTETVYDPNYIRNPAAMAAAEAAVNMHTSNGDSGPNAEQKPPPPNAAGVPLLSQWQIHGAGDALERVKPLEWLVQGVLSYPSLNIMYGGPGSLKSMILAYLATCVASGSRFLDVFPLDGVPPGQSFATYKAAVLWVDLDNGKRRTQARIGAMLRGLSLPASTPFDYVSMPVPPVNASLPESIHNLALLIKSKGYKLIVIDNLGLITGDVEENGAGMASVMGRLRWLVEECDCAVVLIHHQRKSATSGNDNGIRKGESLRGHSSIEAALDLAILIERKGDNLTILPTKVRDFLDFEFIGAKFIFKHYEGSRDMEWARFYSTNSKSKEQEMADALEDAIIEEVRAHPGIGHQRLANLVKDTLSAKKGKSPGINIIRGTITELAKQGKLQREGSETNGYQYFV